MKLEVKSYGRRLEAFAPLVLVAVIVLRQAVVVGWGDARPDLLVASGGSLQGVLDGPRALTLHAGPGHLLLNLALGLLFGWLWCRIGRIDHGTSGPRRVLAATAVAALGGMASLVIAAAMTGVPRVGASGGVYALVGALWPAVLTRRKILAEQTGRGARAWALPLLFIAALPLVGLADGGQRPADHLSHLLGFGLGAVLGFGMEKPRVSLFLAALAALWLVAGLGFG